MHKRPLLIMLGFFIAGILVAEVQPLTKATVLWLVGAGLTAMAAAFVRQFWFQKLRPLLFGAFFLTLGATMHYFNSEVPPLPEFNGKNTVTFEISRKLNSTLKYRRFEIKILDASALDERKTSLGAVLNLAKTAPAPDFKHYYRVEAFVNRVKAPEHDFQYNYAEYLTRKKIFYQLYGEEIRSAAKPALSLGDVIRQRRLEVLQRIDSAGLSPRVREFTKGIILADRTELDRDTVLDFNRSGLVHLLAISGSHMVVIFSVMLYLLKFLPLRDYRIKVLLALVVIWLFGIFIDYGSSVVRSCIMITVYHVYVMLQRRTDLLQSVAIAGFALLIFDTQQLFDVGFQLSFLAVLGIYWFYKPLRGYFKTPPHWSLRLMLNVGVLSISAQLATFPLVVYYFHQYSLISLVANLLVVPFAEVIIVFSLFITVLIALKFPVGYLSVIYGTLVDCLHNVVHAFAKVDVLAADHIAMSLGEVLLLLSSFYFLRKLLLKKHSRSLLASAFFLLIFFAFRLGLNFKAFNKDEIVALKNYQSTSVIIKHRDRAVIFSDQNADTARIKAYAVDPYLSSRRVGSYEVKELPEAGAVHFNGLQKDLQ